MGERLNYHHIVFHRGQWESGADTKCIRQNLGMIALIEESPHRELHRTVPGVPLIDIYMARRVKSIMGKQQRRNPLEAIDAFCFAVEEAMKHPRTYKTERAVGEAAIEVVRMQIPFVKEAVF